MGWDGAAEVFPSSSPGLAVASQPPDSPPGPWGSCSHRMIRLTALPGREGAAAATPVPVAEARDKQATGPELLRDRIKQTGGVRWEWGEGCAGEMANPAGGSHGDSYCLRRQTPTSQVFKCQAQRCRSTSAPTAPQQWPSRTESPWASCSLAREPTCPPSYQEQVGEQKRLPPASAQPSRAQPRPRSSPTYQGTDSRARTAGRCVWHHGPTWAILTHSTRGLRPPGCLGHGTPPARALCHTPLGQAGPARACRAAGKQVGQEPAAPPGQPQAGCATGTEPTGTRADPRPTTQGAIALPGDSGGTSPHPRGSIHRAAMGGHPALGGTPQLGDPRSVAGDPRSVAGGTVSRGGQSLTPAGMGPHPAASRSTPAAEGTPLSLSPRHSGTQHGEWAFWRGTHTYPGVGCGEWGPAIRKGAQESFRDPGDRGGGVSWDPVTGWRSLGRGGRKHRGGVSPYLRG